MKTNQPRTKLLWVLALLGGCAVPSYSGGGGGGGGSHLVRGSQDNLWYPEPGYTWSVKDQNGKPIPGQMAVQWRPGSRYFYAGVEKWPHLTAAPTEGIWFPEPGYTWVEHDAEGHPPPGKLAVQWTPGHVYHDCGVLKWPHVAAAPEEGKWRAKPGWAWTHLDANGKPIPGDFALYWKEGMRHIDHPHVLSAAAEEKWLPQPGYTWTHLDANGKPIQGDFAVNWKPGLSHPKWPHVVSMTTEGKWFPADGYAWTHLDAEGKPIPGDLAVQWKADMVNSRWPHVVSASKEGDWVPEDGYTWARLDENGKPIPGELGVVSIAAQANRSALNDRWIRYLKESQEENDYPNWPEPPYTLYTSSGPK